MRRALAALFTANLLLAIMVVGVYIAYGFASSQPIDQHFLGSGPMRMGRGADPMVSPWVATAIVEGAILVTFLLGLWAEWNPSQHRFFCGVFGVSWLFILLIQSLPRRIVFPEDSATRALVPGVDNFLAWYVWGSHLAYGLFGPCAD